MKKLKFIIVGLLSATLLLGACGTDESKQETKQENKKEQVTKDKQDKKKVKAHKQNEKVEKQQEEAYKTRIANESEETQQNAQQKQTQVEQQPQQEVVQEPVEQKQTLSNMNENAEDNRNGYGEDTVSPGYENQAEENKAYEEYKQGKQAQAEAGPSAVPGAGLMDLSDEE